ncbi:MAG: hypothetical protein Q7S78_00260 [Candidatus Azambacteria bacterium]|nr:hypothetical protein [Candidatus Azambacteria bacterium]
MFVYVGGVSGVGKSKIVTEAEKLARKRGIKMELINGATILCGLTGATNISELQTLSENARLDLHAKMNQRLYEIDRQDPKTIRVADGYFMYFDVPKVSECGIRELQPWNKNQILGITILIAEPHIILRRRIQDIGKRPDRKCDLRLLIQEQYTEIKDILLQAAKINMRPYFIRNEVTEGSLAAEALLSFCTLQAFCGKISRH